MSAMPRFYTNPVGPYQNKAVSPATEEKAPGKAPPENAGKTAHDGGKSKDKTEEGSGQ